MMIDLKTLEIAWEKFIDDQTVLPYVDPIVANSWRRCWPRLNPYQDIRMHRLTPANLLTIQVSSFDMMSVARPIMEDIYQYTEGSDTAIVLINGKGYVLDIYGDESMIKKAEECFIYVGSLISEGQMGSNALAIPLYDGVPAHTVGPEHYLKRFHPFACVAAPIFSLTGRPLGTLGVISLSENYHQHSLGMVVTGARAIEGQLQTSHFLTEQNTRLTELNTILASLSEGILVWDSNGVLMHANQTATKILGQPLNSMVGRPVLKKLKFPPYLTDALKNKKPLRDVEVNIDLEDRTVNSIISLDFIYKNQDLQWAVLILRPAEAVRQLIQRQIGSRIEFTLDDFVGQSPLIRQARRMARSAAPAKASILIRGESGTGKNMLARAIHIESPRREGPFIIVPCSSMPSELILGEIAGFDEGGFPGPEGGRPSKFELAHEGTLYLQDVENLPLEAQAMLLNVIDLGIVSRLGGTRPIEVDIRVIASTTANLERLVADGNLRADLYYRLSPFEISLPPLRERRNDIHLLAERIIQRQGKFRLQPQELAEEAVKMLTKYSWPGNVRELDAVLERASMQAGESRIISPMHFPQHIQTPGTGPLIREFYPQTQPLEAVEREAIIQAARQCKGNLSQMAKVLGIGRTTVWRKLKDLNISPEQFRNASKN